MNSSTTRTSRMPVHAIQAVAGAAAVVAFTVPTAAGASAIPNVPDPAPAAHACDPVRDGECNVAMRHEHEDVFWWVRFA